MIVLLTFRGLLKSALWMIGSRADACHGYDWRSAREPLASCLYDHRHRVGRDAHAITRNRLLASLVLGYEVSSIADCGISLEKKRNNQIVFLHGTSRQSKALNPDLWRQLATLFSQAGFQLLLPWYSLSEKEQAEYIAKAGGELLPKMSIQELAAVLAQSRMVVAVDTGLAHLSAAVNTPTVGLYLDTDPELVGILGSHCVNLVASDVCQSSAAGDLCIETIDSCDMQAVFSRAQALIQ